MYFYYRPKTQEVVMRSRSQIEAELPYFTLTPSASELEMIVQNYDLYHDHGKLKFEEPEHIRRKIKTDDLKKRLNHAIDITEIKTIVKDILNLL